MPTPSDPRGSSPSPTRRPWTLAALVAIVGSEAIVLVGLAAAYAVGLSAGQARVSPGGALFTLVLLAAFGAWLAAAAVFLWRGYRWPRAAALVAQLFALVIGGPALTGGFPLYGVLILVPAVAAAFLLFERRVLAATQRSAGHPRADRTEGAGER
ncbi:hypothetical protein [Sinomonas halotolerans]|uniref:Integral membrane protein n=1 Tax=Sinomonas halotolerans TaxID=1644133 RepID=A0ABU9X082_9MICC